MESEDGNAAKKEEKATTRMKDKKAAKKIIKMAKKHPDWYTDEEVRFAKLVKHRIKLRKKYESSEFSKRDSESGGNDGVCGESQQPKQSRESKGSWIVRLLRKAWPLVGL